MIAPRLQQELARQAHELMLDDAYAVAADEAVPDAAKNAAIPVLSREALAAAAWHAYSAKAFTQGRSRAAVEDAWEQAATTKKRLGLAVGPGDDTSVEKWLAGASRPMRRSGAESTTRR